MFIACMFTTAWIFQITHALSDFYTNIVKLEKIDSCLHHHSMCNLPLYPPKIFTPSTHLHVRMIGILGIR